MAHGVGVPGMTTNSCHSSASPRRLSWESPDAAPDPRVIAGNRAALKSVADRNPTFMSTTDKAAALTELVALQAQAG